MRSPRKSISLILCRAVKSAGGTCLPSCRSISVTSPQPLEEHRASQLRHSSTAGSETMTIR